MKTDSKWMDIRLRIGTINHFPNQRFAKDLTVGQEVNRKRIEAAIAISKSIEKVQNIPFTNIETMK